MLWGQKRPHSAIVRLKDVSVYLFGISFLDLLKWYMYMYETFTGLGSDEAPHWLQKAILTKTISQEIQEIHIHVCTKSVCIDKLHVYYGKLIYSHRFTPEQ